MTKHRMTIQMVVFLDAWMGHSRKVASQHYLQVTDADYQRASQWKHSGKQQKADSCNEVQNKVTDIKKPVVQGSSEDYNTMQNGQAPRAEPSS